MHQKFKFLLLRRFHRYLREADYSTYISLLDSHLKKKTRALVADTKQSKQARLPCQPDWLISLIGLSA
jgi:hypothetical protein